MTALSAVLLAAVALHIGTVCLVAHGGLHACGPALRASAHPRGMGLALLSLAIGMGCAAVGVLGSRALSAIQVPAHGPAPDLRLDDRVVVGVGRTRRGTPPGSAFGLTPEEEADGWYTDEYLTLSAEGLFANVHVTGGSGSGKTSGFLHQYCWQAISKYPAPLPPDGAALGRGGRFPPAARARMRARLAGWVAREAAVWNIGRPGAGAAALEPEPWQPYAGLTYDEALARYAALRELHDRKRWGLFVIDRKGDLTDIIRRQAALAGRLEDVVVLEPGGAETHNPLLSSDDPSALARVILTAHEAVREVDEHPFYGPAMSEWLTHAIALIQAATPARRTYPLLLALCRDETRLRSMVRMARERHAALEADRVAVEQGGGLYTGPRVSQNAIVYFEHWLTQKNSSTKQDIVRGITAFCSLFEDDAIASCLCPELPPTFAGFHTIWHDGAIVVVRVPEGRYGNARATAVGVQLLCEAQTAALARPTSPNINQERVATFVVDEATHYLNRYLTRFLSQNRQSRVAVVMCHQVVSQLGEWSSRHAKAFIGNTRTKVCFAAPDGTEAVEISRMLGTRVIDHRSTSTSTTTSAASIVDGSTTQSRSTGERSEHREWPWFSPGDVQGLGKFECVVMEFDGAEVRTPRKVQTVPYFLSTACEAARALTLEPAPTSPHPIVVLPSDRLAAVSYLDVVLDGTAFLILDPLVDDAGGLAGCLITNHRGSLVLSRAVVHAFAASIADALRDATRTVALGDTASCATLLRHDLRCAVTTPFALGGPTRSWTSYATTTGRRSALVRERRERLTAFQARHAALTVGGPDVLARYLGDSAAALRAAMATAIRP